MRTVARIMRSHPSFRTCVPLPLNMTKGQLRITPQLKITTTTPVVAAMETAKTQATTTATQAVMMLKTTTMMNPQPESATPPLPNPLPVATVNRLA